MTHSDNDEQTGRTGSADTEPPNQSEHDLRGDLGFLRRVLRRTRRSRDLQSLTEGALWYVAVLGAVLVTALLANGLLGDGSHALAAWILIGGGAAATLGAGIAAAQLWRQRSNLSGTARALQRAEPAFRNDLAAALEFGETLLNRPDASDRELGFSRQLAATHIRRTARAVREAVDHRHHLVEFLPQRSLWPPIAAVSASLSLCLVAGAIAPTLTAETLRAPIVADSGSAAEHTSRPLVSDIRIKYDPPPYTDRNSRTDRYTTGHIDAVEGTEVTVSARPLREVRHLQLVLNTGSDGRPVEMKTSGHGRRRASFVLSNTGTYTFRADTPDGETVVDPTERRIDIQPDEAPSVSITSHSGTVEVSPEDTLDIEFTVEDDFGIASIKQSYSFVGADTSTTKPVSVPELEETPSEISGSFKLDLRQMSLRPKDSVKFHLKATDNNDRTGPSTGQSDALVLKVSSPEDKHLENIQAQRELVNKLLDLLADYLENPVGERELQPDETYRQVVSEETTLTTLADRAGAVRNLRSPQSELLDRMGKLVETIKNDPLMGQRNITLLDGFHEHLSELHRQGGDLFDELTRSDRLPDQLPRTRASRVADHAMEMEAALESGAIQMMELIASQKMEAVEATAKDIEKLKDRLKRLLEKYKETRDPELKEAIKREINRLRQRMAELTRRMQTQMRQLPKQHLNKDALRQKQLESDTRKMADKLKTLEQRLEEGNIDGALEALEQMGSNLSALNKSMKQQFSDAQPEGLSELDKRVSEMMDEVNQLQSAERDLEKKTKKIRDQRAKQRAEQLREMMKGQTDELEKKVDRQLSELDDMLEKQLPGRTRSTAEQARKDLENLKEAIGQQDLEQAEGNAESALKNLRTMDFNLGLAQRHSPGGSDAKQALQQLDEMVPRGEAIRRQIESLKERANRKLQQSNNEQLQKLAEQQKNIQKQAEKLRKKIGEAGKKFPMLKQKLQPSLEQADKQMGEARQRLQKGQPQGALDAERRVLQELGKLKKQMKRSVRRQNQREGSGSGRRREDIDIPGKGEGASMESLRDEVMKNMKQKKLEGYEREIESYYESLVE